MKADTNYLGAFIFLLFAGAALSLPLWFFSGSGSVWDITDATIRSFKSLWMIGLGLSVALLVTKWLRALPFLGVSYFLALGLYIHWFAPHTPGDFRDALSFLVISGGWSCWFFFLAWKCVAPATDIDDRFDKLYA